MSFVPIVRFIAIHKQTSAVIAALETNTIFECHRLIGAIPPTKLGYSKEIFLLAQGVLLVVAWNLGEQ